MYDLLYKHFNKYVSLSNEEFEECMPFLQLKKFRKRQYILQEGDSLFFDGRLGHKPANIGNEDALILVVYFFITDGYSTIRYACIYLPYKRDL